jgi:hypothetical protein
MRFALLPLVVALTLAAACSTPLASRRARVQQKGTAELAAVPALDATIFSLRGLPPVPHVEGSVRFGILDRTDVQLKIDELLTPEFAVGYQLIGDPSRNDFALTLTGGVRPGFTAAGGGLLPGLAPNISVPLQLLIDIPLYDDACLTAGTRNIIGYSFPLGTDTTGAGLALSPGLLVSASFPFGERYFVRPERAANVSFQDGEVVNANAILGVGIGMTLGDPRK